MEQKSDAGEGVALGLDVGVEPDAGVGLDVVLALGRVGHLHHPMQGNENHRQLHQPSSTDS
jgi:hypothetical protein